VMEPARGRGIGEARFQVPKRRRTLKGIHLLALGLQNAVQNAHCANRFAAREGIPASSGRFVSVFALCF
jgi:hypothetical protein